MSDSRSSFINHSVKKGVSGHETVQIGNYPMLGCSRGSPPWFKEFFTDFFFKGGYHD